MKFRGIRKEREKKNLSFQKGSKKLEKSLKKRLSRKNEKKESEKNSISKAILSTSKGCLEVLEREKKATALNIQS